MLKNLLLHFDTKYSIENRHDFYRVKRSDDIEILKHLYFCDVSNIKIKCDAYTTAHEKMTNVLAQALKLLHNEILPKEYLKYMDYVGSLISIESMLDFLTINTYLTINKAENTDRGNFDTILRNIHQTCDTTYMNNMYHQHFKNGCISMFFDLLYRPRKDTPLADYESLFKKSDSTKTIDKRVRYSFSTFQSNLLSLLVKYSKNEPYYSLSENIDKINKSKTDQNSDIKIDFEKLEEYIKNNYPKHKTANTTFISESDIGYFLIENRPSLRNKKDIFKSFCTYFENIYPHDMSNKKQNIGDHKPTKKEIEYFFYDEEEAVQEMLSCFILDGFYDVDSILRVTDGLKNISLPITDEYIIKVLFRMFLIPDSFNKKNYIDFFFKVLKGDSDIPNEIYFKEKISDQSTIRTTENALNFLGRFINFLSLVFYPLLTTLFEVIYYNTYGNVKVLEEYLRNSNMLVEYNNKTFSIRKKLSNLNTEQEIENFLLIYEYIHTCFMNTSSILHLTELLSIDYLSENSPFKNDVINTVVKAKELYEIN